MSPASDGERFQAELEAEVLAAIRRVLARCNGTDTAADDRAEAPGVELVGDEPADEFDHTWPDGTVHHYVAVRALTVSDGGATRRLLLGVEAGGRDAYGRVRGRIVVFEDLPSRVPLIELAESDDDPAIYAAGVPVPAGGGRRMARDDDRDALAAVPHLADAQLLRADAVFERLADAPTLRLLVRAGDAHTIARHAMWVRAERRQRR